MKKKGPDKASSTHNTQDKAIKKAKEFGLNDGETVIHRKKDGVIRDRRTYPRNKDPRESKG